MPVQQTIYLLSNISFSSYQLNASWGLDSLTFYVPLYSFQKQQPNPMGLAVPAKIYTPIFQSEEYTMLVLLSKSMGNKNEDRLIWRKAFFRPLGNIDGGGEGHWKEHLVPVLCWYVSFHALILLLCSSQMMVFHIKFLISLHSSELLVKLIILTWSVWLLILQWLSSQSSYILTEILLWAKGKKRPGKEKEKTLTE